MRIRTRQVIALGILGFMVTLAGCETLGLKKAPPGQVKKITKVLPNKKK